MKLSWYLGLKLLIAIGVHDGKYVLKVIRYMMTINQFIEDAVAIEISHQHDYVHA